MAFGFLHGSGNAERPVISPPGDMASVGSAASCRCGVDGDRSTRQVIAPHRTQPRGSSKATVPDRGKDPLVASAISPPRILLVDTAQAVDEPHLKLLQSIPTVVKRLDSCADMYLHQEHVYALVILVLHPRSTETAEAAQFVRQRWSAARILLLDSESAAIDDWLYDERVDPQLHPAFVREAVIRLMTLEKYRVSA